MTKLHVYIPFGFALLGIGLAFLHPYAGALIALGGLAAGTATRWLEAVEVKTAKELIEPLGQVVNTNASKLETTLIELEGLKAELALIRGAKQLGY